MLGPLQFRLGVGQFRVEAVDFRLGLGLGGLQIAAQFGEFGFFCGEAAVGLGQLLFEGGDFGTQCIAFFRAASG